MSQQAFHPYPPMSRGAAPPMMDDPVLLARLRAQVEYYFSPQNLARDSFLQAMMKKSDNGGAVPVEVICNFPKIRELHAMARFGMPNMANMPADPALLCRALESSTVVSVSEDGQWIRLVTEEDAPASPSTSTASSGAGVPTHPIQVKERTTLILRDVPDGCSADEVLEAFSVMPVSERPKSASRHDLGNLWYVHFATEAQAVAAISATRDQTIRGQAIRAGIKSERAAAASAPQPYPRRFSAPPQGEMPHHGYAVPPPAVGYPAYIDPYYGVPIMHPPPQQYGPPPVYAHMPPQQQQPRYMPMNNGQQRPHPPVRRATVPGYVPVPTQHARGGGGKKRNKKNRKKEWKQQQRNDRTASESPPVAATNGHDDKTSNASNGHGHDRSGHERKVLSEEHFPSLVDKKKQQHDPTAVAPKTAYAQALLKTKQYDDNDEIEQGMSNMTLSTAAVDDVGDEW